MKQLVIWLCSSKSDALAALIRQFSNELDAPVFHPHITLLGSVKTQDTDAYITAVENACSDCKPIEVSLGAIGYEPIIWRSLYYHAAPKDSLVDMHQILSQQLQHFGARSDNYFMPHLSLVYKEMEEQQQLKIIESYSSLLHHRILLFDEIRIMEFIPDDIEGWSTIKIIPLEISDSLSN